MSKYSNWGNHKSKNIKYNRNEIYNQKKDERYDLTPFNAFSNIETVEQVQLTDDISLMLITTEEEAGYAVYLNGENSTVLEANTVSSEANIEDMITRRDIAIGTIITSNEQIDSPESLLHAENNFAYAAENEPHYISNETLPAGCEVLMTYDVATDEYSASIIKNGSIISTIDSSESINSQDFVQTIAQTAQDTSATDARADHNNLRTAEALVADSYMLEIIKNDMEAMKYRALTEDKEAAEAQARYLRALDEADGPDATLVDLGPVKDNNLFEEKDEKSSFDTSIDWDGLFSDDKYNKPAIVLIDREGDSVSPSVSQEETMEEDEGLVLTRALANIQ